MRWVKLTSQRGPSSLGPSARSRDAVWSRSVAALRRPLAVLAAFALILPMVVLVSTPRAQAATWVSQGSPTTNDLNDVYFHDAITGWAVGGGGVIINTVDGSSWGTQASGTTNTLRAVQFPTDASTGYAVGASSTVVKVLVTDPISYNDRLVAVALLFLSRRP